MRRREFREVALSLSAPGTLAGNDSQQHNQSSVSATAFGVRRQMSMDQVQQRRSAVQRQHKLVGSTHSLYTSSTSSTASTLRDSDTDTADYESTPINNLLATDQHKKRQETSVARNKGSPVVPTGETRARKIKPSGAKATNFISKSERSVLGRIVSSVSRENSSKVRLSSSAAPTSAIVQQAVQGDAQTHMEEVNVQQRVDGWIMGLKAALQLDAQDKQEEALEAYNR
nr:uncharacterized protein LOC128690550 [Cherax quadricarinatus]